MVQGLATPIACLFPAAYSGLTSRRDLVEPCNGGFTRADVRSRADLGDSVVRFDREFHESSVDRVQTGRCGDGSTDRRRSQVFDVDLVSHRVLQPLGRRSLCCSRRLQSDKSGTACRKPLAFRDENGRLDVPRNNRLLAAGHAWAEVAASMVLGPTFGVHWTRVLNSFARQPGQSDQDSSLCPLPPRSHGRTPVASRRRRRIPRWLAAERSNRRGGRRPCPST